MEYSVMYRGMAIDEFTSPSDAEAKKHAMARFTHFDTCEDRDGKVICTKPKTT